MAGARSLGRHFGQHAAAPAAMLRVAAARLAARCCGSGASLAPAAAAAAGVRGSTAHGAAARRWASGPGGGSVFEGGAAEALPPPPPPSSPALRAAKLLLGGSVTLLGGGLAYVAATYDAAATEELLGPDGRAVSLVAGTPLEAPVAAAAEALLAARHSAAANIDYFAEPSSKKLLPDLPPHAASYMRTLVLDLDGVLVKSDWNRERGWRTFKRPGVDAFLKHMAQYYEVVVFTDQLSTYGDPILERLDPARTISYRLYRDATQYTRGEHARDLAALNRDLSRVVFVGANPGAWLLQPENALPVKAWGLEKDDTVLLDLMPFLESMVRRNVPDTRAVLRSYAEECATSGKDVPTIFRERSAQVATWLKSRDQAPRQLPLLRGRGAKKAQEQSASSS